MNIQVLTSRDNPLIRTVRLVATQARRAPAELVLAEGVRVLEEAAGAGCAVAAALVSEAFGHTTRERALLTAWLKQDVPVRRATASLFQEISDVVSPQGALALIRVPRYSLESLPVPANPLALCLSNLQDPGNLGTILRSARAAGVAWVATVAGTVSARNPKAVRAGAGALFSLPLVEGVSPAELVEFCRARGMALLRAEALAAASCWDADLRGPLAIVLGNEARGLPHDDWSGTASIRIPMAPGSESLNVAAAGAILLFEAFRQRSGNTAATGEN